MISCQKATELMSRSMEEPLGIKDELILKFHLFICECCEQFRKQLDVLRSAVRRSPQDDEPKLSSAVKDRICDAIKEKK